MEEATFNYKGTKGRIRTNETSWVDTPIASFLNEWYNSEDYVMGHTSGSTGEPKQIKLSKKAMIASARLTNQFFGLTAGKSILLCLSTDYIAGKMVVVRAIVGGLKLIVADTKSLPEWNGAIDFAALVPMQVEALLHHDTESRERIKKLGTIIIGGSPLSAKLQKELVELGVRNAYITYGMTETLSHVAIAKVTGNDEELVYNALSGINFTTDARGCLVINAPHIQTDSFITNDVVALKSDTSFVWEGRFDNVVNSGGVKLFPEKIEKKIAKLFEGRRFYLKGEPDARLGSQLVLKIEGEALAEGQKAELKSAIKEIVGKYEVPKEIINIEHFEETTSGKVKRK